MKTVLVCSQNVRQWQPPEVVGRTSLDGIGIAKNSLFGIHAGKVATDVMVNIKNPLNHKKTA